MNKNQLNVSEKLIRGQRLISENGRYELVLQESDGHLVLYDLLPHGNVGKMAIWPSGIKDKKGWKTDYLGMQNEGNLVVGSATGKEKSVSKTSGQGPSYLVVQNDGNVVIYKAGTSEHTWSTSTQLSYLVMLGNAKIGGSLVLNCGASVPIIVVQRDLKSKERIIPNGTLQIELQDIQNSDPKLQLTPPPEGTLAVQKAEIRGSILGKNVNSKLLKKLGLDAIGFAILKPNADGSFTFT
jgi:hypothetical protein